jgi:hypothetical protein
LQFACTTAISALSSPEIWPFCRRGDLARMLSALGRDEDAEKLRQLRCLIEIELGLGIDR